MILSAHQPAYLPWPGYFDKIARADVFVYLDTVQFEKNSFINRNQIKTAQGALWLTVPIKTKGHTSGTLRTTEIDDSQPWRAKHLKTIDANYRKAPKFEQVFPKIESLINFPETNLADYCYEHLQFWLNTLGIVTPVIRSSALPICSSKSDLVLDLCRHCHASHYVSGALGKSYLVEEAFKRENIRIEYQGFQCPNYPQLWGDFIPNLSILDSWMNGASFNFSKGSR